MTADGPVDVELTDDERHLVVSGLNEYLGPATGSHVLGPLVGVGGTEEFCDLVTRLMVAVETAQPLSQLDWTRAVLLTEISWCSDVLGAASEIQTTIKDTEALPVLRSLQRKLVTGDGIHLLSPT